MTDVDLRQTDLAKAEAAVELLKQAHGALAFVQDPRLQRDRAAIEGATRWMENSLALIREGSQAGLATRT